MLQGSKRAGLSLFGDRCLHNALLLPVGSARLAGRSDCRRAAAALRDRFRRAGEILTGPCQARGRNIFGKQAVNRRSAPLAGGISSPDQARPRGPTAIGIRHRPHSDAMPTASALRLRGWSGALVASLTLHRGTPSLSSASRASPRQHHGLLPENKSSENSCGNRALPQSDCIGHHPASANCSASVGPRRRIWRPRNRKRNRARKRDAKSASAAIGFFQAIIAFDERRFAQSLGMIWARRPARQPHHQRKSRTSGVSFTPRRYCSKQEPVAGSSVSPGPAFTSAAGRSVRRPAPICRADAWPAAAFSQASAEPRSQPRCRHDQAPRFVCRGFFPVLRHCAPSAETAIRIATVTGLTKHQFGPRDGSAPAFAPSRLGATQRRHIRQGLRHRRRFRPLRASAASRASSSAGLTTRQTKQRPG